MNCQTSGADLDRTGERTAPVWRVGAVFGAVSSAETRFGRRADRGQMWRVNGVLEIVGVVSGSRWHNPRRCWSIYTYL